MVTVRLLSELELELADEWVVDESGTRLVAHDAELRPPAAFRSPLNTPDVTTTLQQISIEDNLLGLQLLRNAY